ANSGRAQNRTEGEPCRCRAPPQTRRGRRKPATSRCKLKWLRRRATSGTCSCGAAQLIRLRQRERWPNQVHVALAVQLRVSSKVVKLRRFLKEGFHLSGGLEANKDLSWIFANVRP